MRTILIIPVFIYCVASIISCNKSTTTPAIIGIPWNLDSLMPTYAVVPVRQASLNASAVLVACSLLAVGTDTGGQTKAYSRNWEAASFVQHLDTRNSGITDASINGVPLHIDPWYPYLVHNDTTCIWNESGTNHWNVTGTALFPSISADISGTLPLFTGYFPSGIDGSSDFIFGFNTHNTLFADSAFIVVGSNGDLAFSNIVSTSGGAAIIPATKLKHFKNDYRPLINGREGPAAYFGMQVMFVLFRHTIQTIGGRQIAFVKQREIVGIVPLL